MPKQVGKSVFGAVRKSFDERKSEEIHMEIRGGSLPAGIEGGVARVKNLKVDVVAVGRQNAGKPYYLVEGTVVSPEEFEGMKIEGSSFPINEPLYDTQTRSRKSVQDHVDWMLWTLQELGVSTDEVDFSEIEDGSLFSQLMEGEEMFFKFRTWKGQKQTVGQFAGREPQVRVEFVSGVEEPGGSSREVSVEEGGSTEADTNYAVGILSGDLEALGKAADAGDDAAIDRLTEEALKAGLSQKDVDDAKHYSDIVPAIQSAGAPEPEPQKDDEEDNDDGEWIPQKGENYYFKPPKAKSRFFVEIMTVNKSERTVTAKKDDDGRIYKSVSWDKLEGDE